MKKSHTKNGVIILIVLSIIAKAIGVFYRVPLFAILGAGGMGLYQLVFPLYAFAVAFMGGSPVAVSRSVSESFSESDVCGVEKITDTALVVFGGGGFVLSLILTAFAPYVSVFLGNSDTKLILIAISPSVFFSGIIAVMRGYMQGVGKSGRVGISFVSEQVLKLSGIAFAEFFSSHSLKLAVVGAMLGITLGEFVTALVLVVAYLKSKRRKFSVSKTLSKELALCGLSLSASAVIFPLSSLADSFLTVNVLASAVSRDVATALYGLVSGVVAPLFSVPSVINSSFCSWLLPRLCCAEKSRKRAVFGAYAKFPLAVSSVVCFSIAVFAERILALLFGLEGEQLRICIRLIVVGSPTIILACAFSLVTVYLNSLNKSHLPMLSLLIATVVRVVVTPIALRAFSVYGNQVVSVLFYLTAFVAGSIQAIKNGFGFSVKTVLVLFLTGLSYLFFAGGVYMLEPTIVGCILGAVTGGSVACVIFIKLSKIDVSDFFAKKAVK